MYDLQFTTSAADFVEQARGYLTEHPVVENVVATTAERAIREDTEGVVRPPERPWWFCVIRDGEGEIVGVAMRTAPAPDFAVWVGGLPADAADALADQLIDRGEAVSMITGSQPPARVLADRMAEATAGRVAICQRTRLFELDRLLPPTGVSGNLRAATQDDLDLVHRWREVFLAEAEEQAGRPLSSFVAMDPEDTRRRIRDHQFWLWEDGGQVVHLTGASPPGAGVARIAPVYTPKQFRGNGYAMAAVAAVSQILRDQGARVCLFTDQANPVSNKIYQRIGYRPVLDMEQLIIE
jgi:RimJ/RimL family protein N-acetyltransferase